MHRFTSISAFLLGIFITLSVLGIAITIGLLWQDARYKNLIYHGTYVDGINVGGMKEADLKTYYREIGTRLKSAQIELVYKDVPIATYSGEMLELRTNGSNIAEQSYLIGRSGNWLSRAKQKIQLLTRLRTFNFTSHVEYNTDSVIEALLVLENQYNVAPKNALFEIKNGKVSAFTVEKDGLKVEDEKALEKLRTVLGSNDLRKGKVSRKPYRIIIESTVLKPDVTLAKANTLGIEEVIGVGTSDYSGSIPGRVHNLLLASQRLHGTLIPKGEEFSFNKALGEVSGATGYQPAYVILNGRTVLGDGGGVCQTSTTMFRAAIASGLPITTWLAHAYRVHYYENDGKPGRDATVYSPSQDFKFRNDTPAAILIQTEADTQKNLLKYTFWGKKDDRKISISDVGMGSAIPAPPPKEEEDPTLPRGQRRQVDWAADGLKTWFDYKVTKGEQVIQEKTFVSNYRPWQAVYLVGTKD